MLKLPEGHPFRAAYSQRPDELPTHATVDGKKHKIAKIEEHLDGPAHTHRVHLGCGMTIDVDIGGVKKAKIWADRAEEVLAQGHHRIHKENMEHHKNALKNGHTWKHERWHHLGDEKAADCEACAAHENGADPVVHDPAHNPAKTVQADIPTAINCPQCGYKIYKRRSTGEYACCGSGHVFDIADLMKHVQDSFHSLVASTKE